MAGVTLTRNVVAVALAIVAAFAMRSEPLVVFAAVGVCAMQAEHARDLLQNGFHPHHGRSHR